MVSVVLEIIGNPFVQSVFNLIGVVACGDTHAVGNAENVGIDCDGGMPPIHLQDDVRRFSADSRQGGQFLDCFRNIPVELINESAAASMNVFGLRSKESGCLYRVFKFFNARCCHFVRVRPPFK